jgi:hypothetical protein
MGVAVPDDVPRGTQIKDFYEKGDWGSVERHNRQDLEVTEKLYLRVRNYLV